MHTAVEGSYVNLFSRINSLYQTLLAQLTHCSKDSERMELAELIKEFKLKTVEELPTSFYDFKKVAVSQYHEGIQEIRHFISQNYFKDR